MLLLLFLHHILLGEGGREQERLREEQILEDRRQENQEQGDTKQTPFCLHTYLKQRNKALIAANSHLVKLSYVRNVSNELRCYYAESEAITYKSFASLQKKIISIPIFFSVIEWMLYRY